MNQPFADTLARTLKWEGGYSVDAADKGGETYCGISRKNWPEWPGWGTVDRILRTVSPTQAITALAADAGLQAAVASFYQTSFWEPLQADKWTNISTGLVMDVFDCAVNCGMGEAVKLLQQALGMSKVQQDGAMGPITLAALQISTSSLEGRYAALRALHYASIVSADASQIVWLGGWLQRALASLLA